MLNLTQVIRQKYHQAKIPKNSVVPVPQMAIKKKKKKIFSTKE